MKVAGKVIVVTGGAAGIGRALAARFIAEGARHVAIVDIDGDKVTEAARALGCAGLQADVSLEAQIQSVIAATEAVAGPIDLFCSNAGIGDVDPDFANAASAPNEMWARDWAVHVMAHVYAARALLPQMIARGSGYFLNTSSAAGLLTALGSAVYSTTKHAAVAFAESLAITHRDHGIRVSILCPQAVDTAMIRGAAQATAKVVADLDGVITPEQVADCVIDGLDRETFLILPHPEVGEYIKRKTQDYDRWIGGMAKLRRATIARAAHDLGGSQ
jgi:NAD(P)-dependent dehydrogenase (short-subunit alcohol dehydrogenase family)